MGRNGARKVRKWNWLSSQQASEKIQPLQCGCEGRTGIVLCAFIWFSDCMLMLKATQNSAFQRATGRTKNVAGHLLPVQLQRGTNQRQFIIFYIEFRSSVM